MPDEIDEDEVNQNLAATFRDPNWIASRNHGKAFAMPEFRNPVHLDKAEVLGRNIGDWILFFVILPLRIIWTGLVFIGWFFKHINAIMVFAFLLWLLSFTGFLTWLGFQ